MKQAALRVVVVGAGVMGASAAWHLARNGARVTVLEKDASPASGVTRWSYGWVGTNSSLPSDDPSNFASKAQAAMEFNRLERGLGPLPIAARGSLVWLDSDEETAAHIAEQQAFGVRIAALDRAGAAAMEPRLATLPALAAWAPDDFAVEPREFTHQLLDAAREAGSEIICGTSVESVETRGGRVAGVRTTKGVVAADIVVLANARAAAFLTEPFGIALPLREEPAVLMRFAGGRGVLRHLICGVGVELRPGLAGDFVSAEDYPFDGKAGLPALADRTSSTIARMFALSERPTLLSVNAAYRPMTEDGVPLRRFLTDVEGLYAIVAHPGVILAPQLGRLAAEEMLGKVLGC
ncbi:NAD(P)/FAD-dependent oxidoreductase [Ochrobactrum sp. BTU1]|uniref:NAD(P)/FAD-dependent oxidoreductase n=1 Tax=Ochrobactrum sp. BTU1 TaxID=2840456 RepID=UPI001C047112|nr:FAD-binding oxidoreductase [Ochrobactrum sp. BTU1]